MTPSVLDDVTLRRLAFIRYLYRHAVEQSQQPEPLCAVSILSFHDSIELFLYLASEYKDVGRKEVKFMGYWEILKSRLPDDGLTQKQAMRRLNDARGALKHQGTMPSRLDIEGFRASATNFFQENTPVVFGVNFDDISMMDLVAYPETRSRLQEAEDLSGRGDVPEAMRKIAIGFQAMIDAYERTKMIGGGSPFSFSGYGLEGGGFGPQPLNLKSLVDNVRRSIQALQFAVRILTLGLDYRRYARPLCQYE